MKPPPFEYVRAGTLDEALEAYGAVEDARLLAGGQSLVPMMNLRLARPALLVDVNGLSDLDAVERTNGRVSIGALCRHRRLELDPEIADAAPLLADAAALIGHPQIRNRGTLGGSLAHADPASELGAAVVALGGEVVAATAGGGRRSLPATALFEGFLTTTLEPAEMIVEVRVPARHAGDGAAIREFAPRHGDFAVAGVAAAVRRNAEGALENVGAAAFGAGVRVVDLSDAFTGLTGAAELTDELLRGVAASAAAACEPLTDVHASAEDRRELIGLLTVEVIRSAWQRAGERHR